MVPGESGLKLFLLQERRREGQDYDKQVSPFNEFNLGGGAHLVHGGEIKCVEGEERER